MTVYIQAPKNNNKVEKFSVEATEVIKCSPGDRAVIINIKAIKANDEAYSSNIRLSTEPTGNCQTALIGHMDDLISYLNYCSSLATDEEKRAFGTEVLGAIITTVNEQVVSFKKRLFIIDYHFDIESNIQKYFQLHVSTPYKSTNSSRMILGLIIMPE